LEPFSALEDPRLVGKVDHRRIDILVIAVCAVIACAESWDDIALYGRRKWLRTFLDLPNGIPSHDTLRRVFMLIDPDAFERRFSAWARTLTDEAIDREVVAIAGPGADPMQRRLSTTAVEGAPYGLTIERGLTLGQRAVDGPSNEITAIPELLDALDVNGCIVTLDAMGCQKDVAQRILNQTSQLFISLGLKANHGTASVLPSA
jgi:predicted transposase YbfD/YdcC